MDFYCRSLKLVIEVDGAYHFEAPQKIRNEERQQVLKGLGLRFLRLEDAAVQKDTDAVVKKIAAYIVPFEEKHPKNRLAKKQQGT